MCNSFFAAKDLLWNRQADYTLREVIFNIQLTTLERMPLNGLSGTVEPIRIR